MPARGLCCLQSWCYPIPWLWLQHPSPSHHVCGLSPDTYPSSSILFIILTIVNIHKTDHLKICSYGTVDTFSVLCNHDCIFSETLSKWLCPLDNNSSSSLPQLLANISLLSVCMSLCSSDTIAESNSVCPCGTGFLCVTNLYLHPCCGLCHHPHPFKANLLPCRQCHVTPVCPQIDVATAPMFYLLQTRFFFLTLSGLYAFFCLSLV